MKKDATFYIRGDMVGYKNIMSHMNINQCTISNLNR